MRWSASALKAHCAYPNILGRAREPSAASQHAMDRGTLFHSVVELYCRSHRMPDVMDMEVQGWLELLQPHVHRVLDPAYRHMTEVAWGLSPTCGHVMVSEPRPHVYEAMDGRELLTAGRADLMWIDGNGIHVVDWKTGVYPSTPAPDNLQILAAGLALSDRFEVERVHVAIYYARDGVFDWHSMEDGGAVAEAWEKVQAAASLDDKPHPGDWCAGCWERKRCASAQVAA